MKKLGQRGFTLVEGLLIIIAISLIIGVGYYVYNSKRGSDSTTSTHTTSSTAKPKVTKPAKKYLEIPELGIKFEINDKLKDAYYYMHNGSAYLSVHYFDNIKGFEGCTASGSGGTGGGLAAIDYAKVGDDHFGSPWTEADLKAVAQTKIGDTYYWIEPNSQAPCYDVNTISESDPNTDAVGTYKSAFFNQGSTITKIQ